MAEKTIDQNPKITDTIVFDLLCPGADGCFTANPYKIDSVVIYYVERDFIGDNWGTYDKITYDPNLLQKVTEANAAVCKNPSPANLAAALAAQNELNSSAQTNTFYYKDAVAVQVLGSSTSPAWLASDPGDSLIVNVPTDADGNTQYGVFNYSWSPNGSVREGDFFICWTWTPLSAGSSLSAHVPFSLVGDPRAVVTIPSHLTPDNKYNTLLERYLPEMYKQYLGDTDLTPDVTDKLNQSVADGFTLIENLANQLIDLFDANALHESMLVYLSNLFNLRLKSNDPTLWRRQIKEAVPLFKQKGTLAGLTAAFSQAGMSLNKLTRLWQVVSLYTWQESFLVEDSPSFKLTKLIRLPIDPNNFSLAIRRRSTSDYVSLPADNVIFEEDPCGLFYILTWVGDEKSVNPVTLYQGDYLRVLYQYSSIPAGQQSVENYIRSLPYADQRDEAAQEYPPKNWNVRLIEEDDPMFSVVVPVRNPFHELVVFGQVRTEFPFSENIFNMDEWNGSTRDSTDPCMIDKKFVDPCGGCVSSKFSLDLTVDDLSDNRIEEVKEIISENAPFHAVMHSLNLEGQFQDFLLSPVEEIEMLVNLSRVELMLPGEANPIFTRIMADGLTTNEITRSELASQATVVASDTGTLYNDHVSIVVPGENLANIGLDLSHHVLEILAPSPNTGSYTLSNVSNGLAQVIGTFVEPINQSMFTFRISNITYTTTGASITQDDVFSFTDANVSFSSLGVKTAWDVEHLPDYTGGSWQVLIPSLSANFFTINDIGSTGVLSLNDPDRLLPTSATNNISYSLLDDKGNTIVSSMTGSLAVGRRAKINLNDSGIVALTDYVKIGYYLLYSGTEYRVSSLDGTLFHIDGYAGGDANGVTVSVKRRLLDPSAGYFCYSGLKLETSTNYEQSLGILNGDNPPYTDPNMITDNNLFLENFMVQIGSDYYKIIEIDGMIMTLDGLPIDATTLLAGGELVQFSISHFVKGQVEIQSLTFDQIDRRGKDPVIREIFTSTTGDTVISALSLPPGQDIRDNNALNDEVSFTIEYRDGRTSQGVV